MIFLLFLASLVALFFTHGIARGIDEGVLIFTSVLVALKLIVLVSVVGFIKRMSKP